MVQRVGKWRWLERAVDVPACPAHTCKHLRLTCRAGRSLAGAWLQLPLAARARLVVVPTQPRSPAAQAALLHPLLPSTPSGLGYIVLQA